jgi:glycosyltransferase 2 family protein
MTDSVSSPSAPAASPAGKSRLVLRGILSAAITLLFLYIAFRGTDFSKLVESIARANYWWMIPNFACLMISHVLRAWRWRYMLEPVKPNLSMRSLFSGVMVGYMMNNILPRAGELVRPYTIGKLEQVPKSAAFGTIVVERILDMASFLVLVALIPVVYQGPLTESFPWLVDTGIIVSAITIGFLAFFVGLAIRRDWTDRLIRGLEKMLPARFGQKLDGIMHSFLDGFMFLSRPGRFLIITVLSVLIWFLYVVMTYAAFFAFDLGHLGLAGGLVVLAISSIGIALPTPGGTGTYHAFTSQSLGRLYGIDPTVALSYATVTHAVGFIGVTIIGLYYFLRDHIRVGEAVRGDKQGDK